MTTPKTWQLRSLDELAEFQNGNSFKASDWTDSGLPIIRIQNLNGSSSFNYYGKDPDPKWIVEPGSLLFAWAGVKGVSFGPTIWRGTRGVLNQHIFLVKPKGDIDPNWLYYQLKATTAEIESKAHGFKSTLVHVPKGELKNRKVLVPPVGEQRKIASLIDTWEKYLRLIDRELELKTQRQSAFFELILHGKIRAPKFKTGESRKPLSVPIGWRTLSLGEVCSSILDGTHTTPKYTESGIPFYSVESVTNNEFTKTKFISPKEHELLIKRCKPEKGDILLTRIGELGKTKLLDWDVNASIYVSLALLKVNQKIADSRYVYSYLQSQTFLRELKKRSLLKAVPQKINLGDIQSIPIFLPEEKSEQKYIADFVMASLQEISLLRKLRASLLQQKKGLIQQLLPGKARLR